MSEGGRAGCLHAAHSGSPGAWPQGLQGHASVPRTHGAMSVRRRKTRVIHTRDVGRAGWASDASRPRGRPVRFSKGFAVKHPMSVAGNACSRTRDRYA
ncbi:hypothetical protein NN561_020317 [Cricetulus griseus]